jgi:putative transposase
MVWRTSANIVFKCRYRVVFCPKYSRKVLIDPIATRLQEIIQTVCDEMNVELTVMEIAADKVHLTLGDVDPLIGIHNVVKTIKARSYRLLCQEFPELRSRLPTLWNRSYFVATIGVAPLSEIEDFIQWQKRV